MCSCYKENLETRAVPNIQFQVFELSLHSEKEFGVSIMCCKNSMLTGLFQIKNSQKK